MERGTLNFKCILMQIFDTSPKLNVSHNTETNPFIEGWCMVWRSLSDIAFSDTKQLLVGCREQLREKDTEFDSDVSHLMKSMKSKKLLF